MSQLSDKHLPAMINAARAAGIPLGELKPVNPFTQQGQRANMLRAALETVDPVAFAQLRGEAGLGVTLETAAVKAGLIEMTPTAHADLMASDGDYAEQQRQAAIQQEADQLQAMDRMTAEMQRKRLVREHGSEAAADRFIAKQEAIDKAKAEKAARDAESARQLQKRIEAKQAEIARQARLAQVSVATGVTG